MATTGIPWSYPSALHTPSLRGAQCKTYYSYQRHFLFFRRAWLQSAVTWDSKHLKWNSVVLRMQSPRRVSQGGSQVSALLTERLNIAAAGTSFHVTDSTDIDFSKRPLTTIDITEQNRDRHFFWSVHVKSVWCAVTSVVWLVQPLPWSQARRQDSQCTVRITQCLVAFAWPSRPCKSKKVLNVSIYV